MYFSSKAVFIDQKNSQVHIDQSEIRKAEKYVGKWVLETNDDTICLEDAACDSFTDGHFRPSPPL